MTKTAPRVRQTNLYTVERDGLPVAQALAISQAEAVRLYVESVQQPMMTARLSSPMEARSLAGLPLLQREPVADTRTYDLFKDVPDMPVSPAAGAVVDAEWAPSGDPVTVLDGGSASDQEAAVGQPGEPAACLDAAPTAVESAGDARPVQIEDGAADPLQRLLSDAYRLGLNEAGLPGQVVGELAFEMQKGLYITDADAVKAEWVRGCGNAWKQKQEATAVPQGESLPVSATDPASPAPAADARSGTADGGQRSAEVAPVPAAQASGKVAAKYRNQADGSTWTGQGLKPRWMVLAIEAGQPAGVPTITVDPESVFAAAREAGHAAGLANLQRGTVEYRGAMLAAGVYHDGQTEHDWDTGYREGLYQLQQEHRQTRRSVPAAKYRDPLTSQTWSGRGLKPKWLLVALEAGQTLKSFAVEGAQA